MRRLLVIGVLLAIMLAVTKLQVENHGAHDPLTLAAIGFVVLAAFAIAELGSALTLPRVTGYIVAGVALGPFAGNILSKEVVEEMRMFNTLALGLIATSAGLELDARQIVKLARTLMSTIAAKIVLSAGLVAGTLVVAENLTHGLGISGSQLTATAIVIGVLSIGTSPSIVLAVLSETRAKGRLADLVLGAAVFKDLVVVVCLAVGVAIAKTLINPGSTLDPVILLHVAEELGGSLIAGALLGGILILYLKFVRAEMLLFVAAMILVVAEVCRAFHLELLLVFIAAGFVVRNFSEFEHRLMEPLELVALPVFVVFFTNAGASVDLRTTLGILPIALAICVVRAAAYYLSARFGGAIGRESPAIQQNAWLAYLPQAGVTLGLVGLAANQLPELSSVIMSTGTAVVAINLLVGPLALKQSLKLVGELPGSSSSASPAQAIVPSSVRPQTDAPSLEVVAQRLAEIGEDLEGELLKAEFERLKAAFKSRLDDFYESDIQPSYAETRGAELESIAELESDASLAVEEKRDACRVLFETLQQELRSVPRTLAVAMKGQLQPLVTDTRMVSLLRARTRLAGFFLRSARVRRVPVHVVARVTLEPRLAELCADAFETWCQGELTSLSARLDAAGTAEPEGEPPEVQLRARLVRILADGFAEYASVLQIAGGPRLPTAALRYSEIEARIHRATARLSPEVTKPWATALRGARGLLFANHFIAGGQDVIRQATDTHLLEPMAESWARFPSVFGELRAHLERCLDWCNGPSFRPSELAAKERCWRSEQHHLVEQLNDPSKHLRASAALRSIAGDIRAWISTAPKSVDCRPSNEFNLDDASIKTGNRVVPLRRMAEAQIGRTMLSAYDDHIRAISSALAGTPRRAREAVEPGFTAIETHLELNHAPERLLEVAQDELRRSIHRLKLLEQRLERTLATTRDQIKTTRTTALEALTEALHSTSSATSAASLGRMANLARRARAMLRQLWTRVSLQRFTVTQRLTLQNVDAQRLRQQLAEWTRHGDAAREHQRWLELTPVRDERLFTVHRSQLESIMEAEGRRQQGEAAAVLVLGRHGSGRSSLINMCEIELTTRRVIRVDLLENRNSDGIVPALAAALECRATETAVREALVSQPTAVVVDDAEVLSTHRNGDITPMKELLGMVTATCTQVFWVVAFEQNSFERVQTLLSWRHGFVSAVTLPPLSAGELQAVYSARRQRSNLGVLFETNWLIRWVSRLGIVEESDFFFRKLAKQVDGNLAAAIGALRRAAHSDGANVRLQLSTLAPKAPDFEHGLSAIDTAILSQLLSTGPAGRERISTSLGMSHDEIEPHIAFLNFVGLLELSDRHPGRYAVSAQLRAPLQNYLRDLGAFS